MQESFKHAVLAVTTKNVFETLTRMFRSIDIELSVATSGPEL
jgi:hypothetical protein